MLKNRFEYRVLRCRPIRLLTLFAAALTSASLLIPAANCAFGVVWSVIVWIAGAIGVSPIWVLAGFVLLLLSGAIGGASVSLCDQDCGSHSSTEAYSLCSGSWRTSLSGPPPCVRLDPLNDCFRYEPCLGMHFEEEYGAATTPKIGPCSDVLVYDRIAPAYRSLDCISIDHVENCYRPVPC